MTTKTSHDRTALTVLILLAAILLVLPKTLNADYGMYPGITRSNPCYQPQVVVIPPTVVRAYPYYSWACRYYRFPVRYVLPWNRPALKVSEKRTGGIQFYQKIPLVEAVYPSSQKQHTRPEAKEAERNATLTFILEASL